MSNLATVDSLVNIFFVSFENFSSHVSKEISFPVPFRATWVLLTFASLERSRSLVRGPRAALAIPRNHILTQMNSFKKMNDPAASSGVSSSLLGRHSVLDGACPVLDTGESSRPSGYRLEFIRLRRAGMTNPRQTAGNGPQAIQKKVQEEVDTKKQLDYIAK